LESHVWLAFEVSDLKALVLRAIKDVNLARNRLCSNEIRVLRHVTRPVNLARMIDPLDDFKPRWVRR
jgi:hypothetical protein